MKRMVALCMAMLACLLPVTSMAQTAESLPSPAFVLPEGANIVTYESLFDMKHVYDSIAELTENGAVMDWKNIGNILIASTLADSQMLLTSGRVDGFFMFYDTMAYLSSKNDDLAASEDALSVDLHLIGNEGNEGAMAQINSALQDMLADGTADALWKTHIEDVISGQEPVAIAIPVIESADVIRVGISGDCPPMDYTTADGKPAGYNTAILAEIAGRANINIELAQIDSGARFIALESKTIDFFFWHPTFESLPAFLAAMDLDQERLSDLTEAGHEGYLLSEPYRTVRLGWLFRK